MRIREATTADAPAIAAVHEASARTAYADIFAGHPFRGPGVDGWAAEIGSALALLAEEKGEVVGFVTGGPTRDPFAEGGEVYALYVAPERWRGGAGSRLLEEAVRRLSHHGELSLWVLEENTHARRFYERRGWRPDGSEKKSFYGALELRYRRRVSSDPGSA